LAKVVELTTRQSEKLLQIRDDIEEVTEVLGFSVPLLLKGCLEARLDLSEDDEEWVLARSKTNAKTIHRKFVGRLMRCVRSLNLVEEDYPERRSELSTAS
jgi:hypothetical protein